MGKIVKTVESNNEAVRKFNISVRKLIEDGERIRDRESSLLENSPKKLSEEK